MTDPDTPPSAASRPQRVFRNGVLADGRRVDLYVDLYVEHGGERPRLAAVRDHQPAPPSNQQDDQRTEAIDLGGRLLLPPMAEPHAHLDKALTADLAPNVTGDLNGAIDAWIAAEQAGRFTHDDMVGRVRAALDRLLLNGVTAVRSHVNVGGGAGLLHVEAVLDAVAPYRRLMDIELVSLSFTPTSGEGSEPNREAMVSALAMGVDLVGGCPHLEPDSVGAIDQAVRWALDHERRLDLHVDETLDPSVLTVREYARRTIEAGLEGRVTASHCVSLGMQSAATQRAVASEIAQAAMAVVPLPQTNLFLQGRAHPTATPRGLTAIHALAEAGVVVAAGADNVQDPFNLVGRSDPLETAALLVMAGHLLPTEAYEMVSNNVRRALGLEPVTFSVGDPADFVAIAAPTLRGAIADASSDRIVVHDARVVATTTVERHIDHANPLD